MAKNIFGEVIESTEAKAVRPVEVRYSLIGKYVQFAKNVTYLFNTAAVRLGYKSVKENVVFQSIFDQGMDQFFESNRVFEIPFTKDPDSKAWRINLAQFESVDDFNAQVEAARGNAPQGSPASEAEQEEGMDEELPEEEEQLGQDGASAADAEEEVEEEDDEIARLAREAGVA